MEVGQTSRPKGMDQDEKDANTDTKMAADWQASKKAAVEAAAQQEQRHREAEQQQQQEEEEKQQQQQQQQTEEREVAERARQRRQAATAKDAAETPTPAEMMTLATEAIKVPIGCKAIPAPMYVLVASRCNSMRDGVNITSLLRTELMCG